VYGQPIIELAVRWKPKKCISQLESIALTNVRRYDLTCGVCEIKKGKGVVGERRTDEVVFTGGKATSFAVHYNNSLSL